MSYFTSGRPTLTSSKSSSQDNILESDYSFTHESEVNQGPWPQQMYPLQIHLNGSAPHHPQLTPSPIFSDSWNNYAEYVSPNENNSPYIMMNAYSPSDSNSLSPFALQPPSNLPQLSPASSDPSRSPSHGNSRLSSPTTAASTKSFMPSPTLSQGDHMLPQDSQVLTSDVCHIYLVILSY